ncbi:MAG: hypothetical protein ACREQV_07485, partial [Candidatus Binatia bacterium]
IEVLYEPALPSNVRELKEVQSTAPRRRPDRGGKIEKAYSLGIPKQYLAPGKSQTEEEYAYGEKYPIC